MNDDLFAPADVALDEPCPVCGGTAARPLGPFFRCLGCRAVLLRCDTAQRAICPRCGASNPPGAQFCGHCGTALGGRLVAVRHCPRCGSRQMPGYAFCVRCGYNVAAALARPNPAPCPTCGQPVPAEETYCAHCGAGLRGQASPNGASSQPYKHCPACGAELPPDSDICLRCGADASDYIGMIRALTRERVARVVAEEEAAMSAAAAPGEKAKRKREDRASIHEATVLARLFFADRSFATLVLLLTLLCIIGMGLLAFFASAPR